MVFNKLRKGDRRSVGNLRGGRQSLDEGRDGSDNNSMPNSPIASSMYPNSPTIMTSSGPAETLHIRNSSGGYSTSPTTTSPIITGVAGGGGGQHGRSPSIGSGGVSPSSPTSGSGNAGWYMTTGVLPAGVAGDDSANIARNKKYDSIYRATGLPAGSSDLTRNTTMRTMDTTPSAYSQPDTYRTRQSSLPQGQQQQPMQQQRSMQQQPPVQTTAVPVAVANAGTTAQQHRRNLSTGTRAQQPAAAPMSAMEEERRRLQKELDERARETAKTHHNIRDEQQGQGERQGGYDPASGQSRFTERMSMIGRDSEDGHAPRQQQQQEREREPEREIGPGRTPASRGDEMTASEIARERDHLPDSVTRREHEGLPSTEAVNANPRLDPESSATSGRQQLPEIPHMTPIEEIATPGLGAAQHQHQPLESQLPILATRSGSGPAVASPTGPRAMRETSSSPERTRSAVPLPAVETVRSQTQGPEQQTSHVSAPQKILSTISRRYQDTPAPTMSHPLPASSMSGTALPQQADQSSDSPSLFGNIAQKVPHYMFVTYQAHVCQECVDSDKKMHKLQHGGEEWRYNYQDPSEERELSPEQIEENGNSTNTTRKTGRRDFNDRVSLIPSSTGGMRDGDGKPCQCDDCKKGRETVKYAAENGLIEKIFNGARHPLSETIETITYTTIVRAPIIEETIETVLCEEPNCPECLKKDEAYRMEQHRALADGYPGMIVHETDGSNAYEDRFGAKDLWGLKDMDGNRSEDGDSSTGFASNSRGRLGTLLERAGNPRQEGIRGLQSTSRGEELTGEDALIGFDRNDKVEAGEECPVCADGSMMSHHGIKDILHQHREGPITKEDILERYKTA